MALTDFVIRNYRSVRDAWLKLQRITVVVGPNGSGKSNLYRAMHLIASAATGQLARNIADEGGMASVQRSGSFGHKDSHTVQLSIKVGDVQYDLTCGMPPPNSLPPGSLFSTDLFIHRELIYQFKKGVRSRLLDRRLAEVKIRDADGVMNDYTMRVASNESVLTGLRDPYKYPVLASLRRELLRWRFYHHFRTDRESPLRKSQYAKVTPVMAHDGSDFVSAFQTIVEMGHADVLMESIDDAFPGAEVFVQPARNGLRLCMKMPEFNRAFDASELSDGTLQYLCLLTALLSLEPPSLLAINEPETSIHPDLFGPLARLLVRVSSDTQIWITTHSTDLADYILEYGGYSPLELEKVNGETRLIGVKLGSRPDPDDDEDD